LFFTLSKQIAVGLSIPSDFPSTVLQRFPSGDITTTLLLSKEATYTLTDNSISLLVKQEGFPIYTYVIASGDNIYHTNHTTNTISCHKINGDKLIINTSHVASGMDGR
jgi:hypothetical protein